MARAQARDLEGNGKGARIIDMRKSFTSATAKVVMPAKAGIQVSFGVKYKKSLDSGMRRNDGSETSLSLEKQRTFRLNPENRRAVAG